MRRTAFSTIAILAALALVPAATAATAPSQAPAHKARHAVKRSAHRPWHGYGFLPGYVPPEVIAQARETRDFQRGRFYAIPVPRFYHGRWNGGGFGPCYTYTPIGPIWNCGR